MPAPHETENSASAPPLLRNSDIPEFLSRMTCACANCAAFADAPIARALVHRVDIMSQPCRLAARELGLGYGDATYLLAGLRADMAQTLVSVLGAKPPRKKTLPQGEIDHD
ncbi:hypothetical protein [Abyssibius alkaniclasticus]|uniref:hypothetical protein n=1 Tax=Abyssibius alkaniclasticus TaxID=2881234 RepID=UPI0040589372